MYNYQPKNSQEASGGDGALSRTITLPDRRWARCDGLTRAIGAIDLKQHFRPLPFKNYSFDNLHVDETIYPPINNKAPTTLNSN